MSVACSGASIVPSAMSAAISIWTWPPEFLVIYQNGSFTMAIEFLVIYQNGSFTIIIATKFLLFTMATEFPVIYHLATTATELSEGILTIAM